MALFQSVPADEIDAEFAAELPAEDDDVRVALAHRAQRAAVEAKHRSGVLRPVEHRRAGDPRDLREATERVRPVAMAHEHTLPLLPAFAELLPGGLARGTTVAVRATQPHDLPPDLCDGLSPGLSRGLPHDRCGERVHDRASGSGAPRVAVARSMGATSLALALAAGPTEAGSWAALVGVPALGLGAAAELGLALERVAVIDAPPPDAWATVMGSLLGAFDLVVFGAPARVSGAAVKAVEVRRVTARARERGTVLVQVDTAAASVDGAASDIQPARPPWSPFEAELRLVILGSRWHGLGAGHGHLQGRQVTVEVTGRRSAARPRRADLWLLHPSGAVAPAAGEVGEEVGEEVIEGEVAGDEVVGDEVVGDLAGARRGRIRRVATRPVRGQEGGGAAVAVWSDAG